MLTKTIQNHFCELQCRASAAQTHNQHQSAALTHKPSYLLHYTHTHTHSTQVIHKYVTKQFNLFCMTISDQHFMLLYHYIQNHYHIVSLYFFVIFRICFYFYIFSFLNVSQIYLSFLCCAFVIFIFIPFSFYFFFFFCHFILFWFIFYIFSFQTIK